MITNEQLLSRAIDIAVEAHHQQKDKFGAPYIGHLMRVMNRGRSLDEKIVGMLHDLIEDTDWQLEDLQNEGFPAHILFAISCLTKKDENEPYDAFTERVQASPLAVQVKLNDLSDNLDVKRMPMVTEKDLARLNKYLSAYRTLAQLSSNHQEAGT